MGYRWARTKLWVVWLFQLIGWFSKCSIFVCVGKGGVIQPRPKSIEAFANCLGPYCRTLRRNSRQGKTIKKQTHDPPSLTIFSLVATF